MPLFRFCFVFPVDDDSPADDKPFLCVSNKIPIAKLLDAIHGLLRRSLHRLITPCRPCFSGDKSSYSFEDVAGVSVAQSKTVADAGPRIFSYSEIYIGTKGFSNEEVIGSGGFGRVYRAVLPSDGTVVAVKCVSGNRGEHFEKALVAELVVVSQLRHRNLVRLRGWCVHDDELLLVYDYMPNRSLDRLLFGAVAAAAPLDWGRRWRIVHGLAVALFYLHEQLNTQIIHRDVKTSNVMLDDEYNARLGDFGLARWLEHNEEFVAICAQSTPEKDYQFRLTETSRISGTIGYLPPEVFQKRASATTKSDVFSFGIVALEVATGRRAVDLAYPDDQIFMLDWVRRLADEGETLAAGDRRLPTGSFLSSEMERLIHLGLLCSLHDPRSRPTMNWVAEALSNCSSGELPALPSFRLLPQYITLSYSTSTTSASMSNTKSIYVTAANTTIYFTAGNCNGSSGEGSGSGGRSFKQLPYIDTPREISYKEIVAITNDFSESRILAELDFGTGYHGYLQNGVHVLVKRLGMRTCPALRARFANELHSLARLRHRHLVQLRGWCTEQGEMLVIYDYFPSYRLSHYLFHQERAVLSWRQRYHIVKCLAGAIRYLHEEWDEQVIHRGITSSAVVLDSDMNPRLSSFSLAEFLSRNDDDSHYHPPAKPSARGIFGYIAPEYINSGNVTAKADVYSFGVVVLEVISGLMAVDCRWQEVLLVKKVWNFEAREGLAAELADLRLAGEFDGEELARLVKLGIACTRSDPQCRPTMNQIVSILEGNDELLRRLRHSGESKESWKHRNIVALSLSRRLQALGIH